jgi:hypothetical protein
MNSVRPQVIISKRTSDNKPVLVFDDGDITQVTGIYFPGVRVRKDLTLSLLIAEEACLFEASEMGALIRAANTLAKNGAVQPGELRALACKTLNRNA